MAALEADIKLLVNNAKVGCTVCQGTVVLVTVATKYYDYRKEM